MLNNLLFWVRCARQNKPGFVSSRARFSGWILLFFGFFVLMDKIAIASDHAGYDLKKNIILYLKKIEVNAEDYGPHNTSAVDYPDYGIKIARAVVNNKVERGIIICGTGIGMSIVVNRFQGIRGTLCGDVITAELSRKHNNSNVLVLGGRVLSPDLATKIVETWMKTSFEGGRHQRRLDKIDKITNMT